MAILFPGGVPVLDTVERLRKLASDLERMTMFVPDPEVLSDAPLLSDWVLAHRRAMALAGRVAEHPVLGDRRSIMTSEIYALDPGGGWARSWTRFYRLGPAACMGEFE
jgi:hypothetical protein